MDKEYKILQLNEDDDKLILSLIETAAIIHNRKKDSIEWFKWKYFNSPFGKSICILALTEDYEIAAEVTFGCYQFNYNGKIINSLISFQTMVHPQHQKKGLFKLLTHEVLRVAKSMYIDLVFNFPNRASYKPFLSVGFTPINHIKNKVFIIKNISSLFSIFSIKKPFIPNTVKEVSSVQLELLNKLKQTIKPINLKNVLCPNRTPEFILWRFFTFPNFDYRIVETQSGWAIIRIGKRGKLKEVQLMEIFPDKDFSSKFIDELKKEIKLMVNPNMIVINISSNHPANKFIRSAGFISLPHNISFFAYAINNAFNELLNKESWIVTATEFHRY